MIIMGTGGFFMPRNMGCQSQSNMLGGRSEGHKALGSNSDDYKEGHDVPEPHSCVNLVS